MRKPPAPVLPAFVASVLLTPACDRSDAPPPPEPAVAPTVEELRNATYTGLRAVSQPVNLNEGRWEGDSPRVTIDMAGDYHVTGDLDGVPPEEMVVVLTESAGNSSSAYLAAVSRRGDALANIATVPLGDGVALRDLRIENRRLIADVLRPGPDDPMCCPGELATRAWQLSGSSMQEIPIDDTPERLSLATLGDGPWMLRAWTLDETAPMQPQVTLTYRDGRFAGSAGCNSYTAPVTAGSAPGDITLGPAVATRKMCPEPEMQVEERYLRQLGAVRKYGFLLGRLALTYERDGQIDTMLFARE